MEYRIGQRTRYEVLEYIRAHPGCARIDIAGDLAMDCDHVRDVVNALSVRGEAYQNQETREHFSIVDGWAGCAVQIPEGCDLDEIGS